MINRSLITSGVFQAQKRLAAQSLKSCPLCGAINAAANKECFVCRWAGAFEQNPEVVQIGLETLIDSCPELAEAMINDAPAGKWRTFWRRLTRMFHRRIDLSA